MLLVLITEYTVIYLLERLGVCPDTSLNCSDLYSLNSVYYAICWLVLCLWFHDISILIIYFFNNKFHFMVSNYAGVAIKNPSTHAYECIWWVHFDRYKDMQRLMIQTDMIKFLDMFGVS